MISEAFSHGPSTLFSGWDHVTRSGLWSGRGSVSPTARVKSVSQAFLTSLPEIGNLEGLGGDKPHSIEGAWFPRPRSVLRTDQGLGERKKYTSVGLSHGNSSDIAVYLLDKNRFWEQKGALCQTFAFASIETGLEGAPADSSGIWNLALLWGS